MFFPLGHTFHLHEETGFRWRFIGLVVAGLLLVGYWQEWIRSPFKWDLAIALTFIYGYSTFTRAFQDVLARKISADQAVTIAALAALYVGEYLAAAEVVYIMLVGETLEAYAARRFQTDLSQLLSCLPQEAHVQRAGGEEEIPLQEVESGERVVVYPGERVPVDGTILEGDSLLDESSITGESLPRERVSGDSLYAGSLNQTSRLLVEAHQVGDHTVLSRIVELVRHARESKAPIQRTADRYAQWFLPLVLGIAAVCYLVTGEWMRSVAILIVACPCAMVLATPAAVLASVSALARRGIIVKGGVQLEKMAQVDCVAFDKTGTLTRGRPELTEVQSFDDFPESQVLAWAASLEFHSEHLLGRAIRSGAEERGLSLNPAQEVKRHAGLGMEGRVVASGKVGSEEQTEADHILVGSSRFLQQMGFSVSEEQQAVLDQAAAAGSIPVLVANGDRLAGVLVLKDLPRPEASETLHQLLHLGIHKSFLLTGDNENSARQIAKTVGISEVSANLLPEEKLTRLEELKREGYTVAMVGDGVNDSPSLAAADVGVAMGDTGTDIAAEASGVILVGDGGLDRLSVLIETSRKTVKTIQDNILWFGFAFNLVAVVAAFLGYLTAVAAAVVHQGSSFLVLMNSLKLLERRPRNLLPHRAQHALHDFQHWWADHWPPTSLLAHVLHWAGHHRQPLLKVVSAAAVALYVLSGVKVLLPDQIGVVERFGKMLETTLSPGLHYVFPWPAERLYRVNPNRVNSLQLGFRLSETDSEEGEPTAYEWNIQHRQGRYIRREEEAVMLTGDEYLVEVNAVVHYSISQPRQFLVRTVDFENTLRFLCEGALRYVVSTMTLDQVLALDRVQIESTAREMVRSELDYLGLGVEIQSLNLQDVHPALEVVDAFRGVAGALEEKSRMINEAHGYANERVPLARGAAQKRVIDAESYRFRRVQRAMGESQRFKLQYEAYSRSPRTTRTRVYLEAVEEGLAGKRKYILAPGAGRRKMMLFQDSVFSFKDLEGAVRSRR